MKKIRVAAISIGFSICLLPNISGQQPEIPVDVRRLTAARAWVSLSELAAHTSFLASDVLYGRAPGTQGSQTTEQYIAAHFQRIGLLPGAPDGTYFQKIPLLGITTNPAVTIEIGGRAVSLNHPGDFVAMPEWPDTTMITGGDFTFVGHGIRAPDHDWDDFKATPVNGRVLLVLAGLPRTLDEFETYGDLKYKLEEAAARGATGVLFVHSDAAVGLPWPALRSRWTRELVRPIDAQPTELDFTGWITSAAAKRIFAEIDIDWDVLVRRASLKEFRPVDIGRHVSIDIKSRIRSFESSNVIGMIRGSDVPERSLLITANHDYLGVLHGSSPDSVYNGARINAANLSGLMTMAGALTAAGVVAPVTLKFVAATGGESGGFGIQSLLWGLSNSRESAHAAIVIDEANLWGPTADISVGGGEQMESDRLVIAAATSEGLTPVPEQTRYKRTFTSVGGAKTVLAQARVPFASIGAGSTLRNGAPSARDLAISTYYTNQFARTSDNLSSEFDFEGLQSQIRFSIRLAWALAQVGATPTN